MSIKPRLKNFNKYFYRIADTKLVERSILYPLDRRRKIGSKKMENSLLKLELKL